MRKTVLLTGVHTQTGYLTAEKLLNTRKFRLLLPLRVKNCAYVKNLVSAFREEVALTDMSLTDKDAAVELVRCADYIVNADVVVPPESCHNPDLAEKINYFCTKNIVDALKVAGGNKRMIELSLSSVYGGRTMKRPYAKVGDPVMPAYFDCASVARARAERYVVESGVTGYRVLRTAPVVDDGFVKRTVGDGWLFHFPLDSPAEFILSEELSSVLAELVISDENGEVKVSSDEIFDVGSGEKHVYRDLIYNVTDRVKKDFAKVLSPKWFVLRNGTGAWLYDGEKIQKTLNIPHSDVAEELARQSNEIVKNKSLLSFFPIVKRHILSKLQTMTDSPYYWTENGMTDRINVFYGGYDKIRDIPDRFEKIKTDNETDYVATLFETGFDLKKDGQFINHTDLESAAAFRGGSVNSRYFRPSDMHVKTEWKCADGHNLKITPYGVLYGGYWCDDCLTPAPWRYSENAKKSPYHSAVYKDKFTDDEDLTIGASAYRDVLRADDKKDGVCGDKGDKIIKYKKG